MPCAGMETAVLLWAWTSTSASRWRQKSFKDWSRWSECKDHTQTPQSGNMLSFTISSTVILELKSTMDGTDLHTHHCIIGHIGCMKMFLSFSYIVCVCMCVCPFMYIAMETIWNYVYRYVVSTSLYVFLFIETILKWMYVYVCRYIHVAFPLDFSTILILILLIFLQMEQRLHLLRLYRVGWCYILHTSWAIKLLIMQVQSNFEYPDTTYTTF